MADFLNVNNLALSASVIAPQAITVEAPLTGDGTSANPIGISAGVQPTYTVLWHTNSPFANMYSFTLNQSIDNFDELIVKGSASRDSSKWFINCENRYVVDPGKINMCCSYYNGAWSTASNAHILCNGTQVWISGNSGRVTSSYFMGQNAGSTAWCGSKMTGARVEDVHPYEIVGVKY